MRLLTQLFFAALVLGINTPSSSADESRKLCNPSNSWISKVEQTWLKLFPEYEVAKYNQQEIVFTLPPTRLAAQSPKQLQISFLDNGKANAFATPPTNVGAKIILTSGLMTQLSSCEELAFVLAHEMSHINNDHFAPDISALILPQSLIEKMVRIHHDWELIADKDAAERLQAKGIDNHYALSLLGKLSKLEEQTRPAWIHWHPDISERTRNLQTALREQRPMPLIKQEK